MQQRPVSLPKAAFGHACSSIMTRWAHDQRGVTAIMFGLVALVIIGMCAFSIDYSRAAKARQTLQDGLDAATLAAARTTDGTWEQAGQSAFKAHTEADRALNQPTVTFTLAEDSITGKASATVKPIFVDLVMRKPFAVGANTEVKRAVKSALEVALVLDTTKSMDAGGKIDTLKVAAKDLIQKITEDPKADVKIAVVPFGQYVNVGVSRRSMPWVGIGADYTTPGGACYDRLYPESKPCTSWSKKSCDVFEDGVRIPRTCNDKCLAYGPTKPAYTQKFCPAGASFKFNGCVGSPAYPRNVEDKDSYRIYPGYYNTACGSELTALTTNKGAAISAVSKLKASGETYIPSGLAWGFNALSNVTPLTEAKVYDPSGQNKEPRKALVLMTDGENTLVTNWGNNGRHEASKNDKPAPLSQANNYTKELCKNIKAAKIEVYTVAFAVTDKDTKDMLEGCASDPAHYFDATDSAALLKAFSKIAESLKSIYIAR
jgi:Flp pilus assembly protein TadG